MNAIRILPDLTNKATCADLNLRPNISHHVQEGIIIGRMPHGTQQGNGTCMIFVPIGNGKYVCAEITLRNFMMAAEIMHIAESGKGN